MQQLPDAPFRVEYEITGVCNLNCIYCYAKPFTLFTPPLSDIKYILRKTKREADPFEIVLLGGEPFSRKDIFEVIESTIEIFNGRRIGISTNGTLLSRLTGSQLSMLKNFVEETGFSIQVSLDSINGATNNITRGRTEEVIAGINTLKKYNIHFSLGIILTKFNINGMLNTIETLIKNNIPFNHINLEKLQPALTMGPNYFKIKANDKDLSDAYYNTKGMIERLGKKDEIEVSGVVDESCLKFPNVERKLDSLEIKSCLAGLTRAGVMPNGLVTPCTTIRNIYLGDLYKESWTDIWNRSKQRFFNSNLVDNQCRINSNYEENKIASVIRTSEMPITNTIKDKKSRNSI